MNRLQRRADAGSLALLAILGLAAVLRAHHLGAQSLWIDEIDEGTTARSPLDQFLTRIRYDFGAAPLDYLGVKLTLAVLGRHGTVATRAWAFAMGCLGVLAVYLLARRMFRDRQIALFAAFMLALSAFHIYYSQEARFYAMAVAVGALQIAAFLRAADERSTRAWLVAALASAAALYTHYFLAVLLPIEAVYLVAVAAWTIRPARSALRLLAMGAGSQALAVAAFAPWAAGVLRHQVGANYPQLPPLDWARVYETFVVLVGMAPPSSVIPLYAGQAHMTDVLLALAAIGLVASLKAGNPRVVLLAAVLAAIVPAAWTADRIGHYFWAERQVIFALVPLYVLAAAGARAVLVGVRWAVERAAGGGWFGAESRLSWRQTSAGVVAGLTIGLAGLWTAAYWGPVHQVYVGGWVAKEDWRDLTAFAVREGCPDTTYWSFLDEQYSYGIGYYDGAILARSRWLRAAPAAVGPDDWIVISSSMANAPASGGTQDAVLRGRGWTPRAFGELVVYRRSDSCDRGTPVLASQPAR